MAYDEGLAERVRGVLSDRPDVVEKKMFGGIAFMVRGNMCVGVNQDNLMLRVGPDQQEAALTRPHARVMDFTKRPMKGFIYVDQAGLETDEDLAEWIEWGLRFVLTLPSK